MYPLGDSLNLRDLSRPQKRIAYAAECCAYIDADDQLVPASVVRARIQDSRLIDAVHCRCLTGRSMRRRRRDQTTYTQDGRLKNRTDNACLPHATSMHTKFCDLEVAEVRSALRRKHPPRMGILRSILNFFLSIFFPVSLLYDPLRFVTVFLGEDVIESQVM